MKTACEVPRGVLVTQFTNLKKHSILIHSAIVGGNVSILTRSAMVAGNVSILTHSAIVGGNVSILTHSAIVAGNVHMLCHVLEHGSWPPFNMSFTDRKP